MTVYIEIQNVDYDDYPLGTPTKVGTFETHADAEIFMEENPEVFDKRWYGFQMMRTRQKHTVSIKPLDSGLLDQETFLTIWKR